MRGHHLAGNLRVARLVGAHQPELVSAKDRNQSIEQKEPDEEQQNDELGRGIAKMIVTQPVDSAVPAASGRRHRRCGV